MTTQHTVDFTFYYDPGHGWLQVNSNDLRAVGLTPHDFSRYSYQRFANEQGGANVYYLEEDCDCGKFIDAYQNKFDHSPHITENANGAFIRRLPHISV